MEAMSGAAMLLTAVRGGLQEPGDFADEKGFLVLCCRA